VDDCVPLIVLKIRLDDFEIRTSELTANITLVAEFKSARPGARSSGSLGRDLRMTRARDLGHLWRSEPLGASIVDEMGKH
jgi:hypothetical protein